MGIIDRIRKRMPGSPGAAARRMCKTYIAFKNAYPKLTEKEILEKTLATRYPKWQTHEIMNAVINNPTLESLTFYVVRLEVGSHRLFRQAGEIAMRDIFAVCSEMLSKQERSLVREKIPLQKKQKQVGVKHGTEGYKKAIWGMSKEEVIKQFSDKTFLPHPDPKKAAIGFEDTLFGEKTPVGFYFHKGKLSRVSIALLPDSSDEEKMTKKYSKVKQTLIEKYSQPRIADDDEFLKDKGVFFTRWETAESLIELCLLLPGDKTGLETLASATPSIGLTYSSRWLDPIAKKIQSN